MDTPLKPTSEDLMLDYAQGNVAAFTQLYALHKAPLFRFILRQGIHREKVDELFQEIWLKVIKARESYQTTARFQTWFYSIARNHLIDDYRKQGHFIATELEEELHEDINSPDIEDVIDWARKKEHLLAEVTALPFEQREAFLLKHEAGMNNEDIALVTGTNKETAKSRIRYAMNQLKKQLGGS
ncbi:MAG: RNA polymerase subunit sigma [Gammaproteobacteria bacterium]|nr:MAG: RNA polymerase subunit sigma [Gammaproteobacteria bacterium]